MSATGDNQPSNVYVSGGDTSMSVSPARDLNSARPASGGGASTNGAVTSATDGDIDTWTNEGVHASTNRGVNASTNEGAHASTNRGVNASTNEGVHASTNRGVHASTNEGVNASTNRGVHATTNGGVDTSAGGKEDPTSEEDASTTPPEYKRQKDDTGTANTKDIIIAIMGPTGAGKSSFIDKATESTGKGVGHDLRSCTSEIKVTRCAVERSNVVLVDTPGFDDTTKSDLEILEMISNWLNQEYQTGTMLSAILYFHRISDNRMAGTPLKNLRVFQKLCGKNAMPKVVLVTTMWDEVDDEVGEQRLAELQDSYWKAMMSRGSTTRKYLNTRDSAVELLGFIVQQERAQEGVRLQEEISDMNLELRETAAGRVLCSTLEDLAKKRMEALRRIQAENKGADEKTSEDLWKEYAQVKAQLDSALTEARALRMSLRQRLNKGIRAAWRRMGEMKPKSRKPVMRQADS